MSAENGVNKMTNIHQNVMMVMTMGTDGSDIGRLAPDPGLATDATIDDEHNDFFSDDDQDDDYGHKDD